MKNERLTFMERHQVDELGIDTDSVLISFSNVPWNEGFVESVLNFLEDYNVNVEILTQTSPVKNKTENAFIVKKKDLKEAKRLTDYVHKKYPGISSEINTNIARLSISGIGMRSQSGVAAKFLRVLSELDVEIFMITTSEIRIAVVIDLADLDKTVDKIKESFNL